MNLYDSGQIDFSLLTGEFVDKYRNNKEEYGVYNEPSTFFIRLNQKTWWTRYTIKSKKLREAIALSIDKKNLTNVILNDGSKPADYLVPKGLAAGPDGKDFQETFKNGVKPDAKKQLLHGKKRKKNLEKIKLQLSFKL